MNKNLTLWVAFALPITFIVIVALVVLFSAQTVTTSYNFVYATCDENYIHKPTPLYIECSALLDQRYKVVDNTLQIRPLKDPDFEEVTTRLFLHDTKTNVSKEITAEEALQIHLNDLLTSPDGVSVSGGYERTPDVFPFFGGTSSYNYYLNKGKARTQLNIVRTDEYFYQDYIEFIGW